MHILYVEYVIRTYDKVVHLDHLHFNWPASTYSSVCGLTRRRGRQIQLAICDLNGYKSGERGTGTRVEYWKLQGTYIIHEGVYESESARNRIIQVA